MDMLYAVDERDLVASAVADLADRAPDPAALAAVAALVERREDARALALLGRTAVGRGLPFEYYAYPIAGLPRFKPIGPQIEPHVAYAIARQQRTAIADADARATRAAHPWQERRVVAKTH